MTFTLKKIAVVCTVSLCAWPFYAQAQEAPQWKDFTRLNKISYQVSVEKWSTTTTANVTINVDAALDKIGLAGINEHVLQNLNKIATSSDWHITQFSRSQDKSGLETLHVEAQARLPGSALANLRDKAKAITAPGETYTVADIDFSPSLAELTQTHAEARQEIYNRVKQEVARLNQNYPEQHYFVNTIDFNMAPTPQPMAARMSSQEMFVGAGAATLAAASRLAPALPVNAKVVESASVVIASLVPGKTDNVVPVQTPAGEIKPPATPSATNTKDHKPADPPAKTSEVKAETQDKKQPEVPATVTSGAKAEAEMTLLSIGVK